MPRKDAKQANRDVAMEAAYKSGSTMQDIADGNGVTRARVQQILAKRGVDSEAGRGARREAQRHRDDLALTKFWDEHGPTVAALAEDGATKAEVLDRFRLTHPSTDLETVRSALATSEVVFSKQDDAHHFPDSALRYGLLYVAALHHGDQGDAGSAIASLSIDDMRETADALISRGFSADEIAGIFAVVAVVQERAASEKITITAKRYGDLRKSFLSRPQSEGLHPWPADAQTVSKRLGAGYWDDAMLNAGLGTSGRGRARGLLVFTEEEYLQAILHYRSDRAALGYKAQADKYSAWRDRELQGGRSRPSQPAVRGHFGSWQAAIRAAVTRPALDGGPRNRETLPGARLLHAARIDMQQGIAAFEAATRVSEKDAAAREFVHSYAQTFEIDRRQWFRAMVDADPAAGARRAAQPKRDLREHAKLAADPAKPLEVLTDTYLDRLLSNDLGDVDGWFSTDVESALIPLGRLTMQYELLRAARNYITHNSDQAATRFKRAAEVYGNANPSFTFGQQVTLTTLLRWLSANNGARLRNLAEVLPSAWTVMVAAEGVLRSEEEAASQTIGQNGRTS